MTPTMTYIECKSSKERKNILTLFKSEKKSLPISLTEDLLCLQIPQEEKVQLLDLTDSSNKLALEHFLLAGLDHWDQDLATFALRKWVSSTDHLLWYRLLPYTRNVHIAQRVQYTILEQCSPYGGTSLVTTFQEKTGLKDFSPAFHALIFLRSAQRGLPSDRLNSLAKSYLDELLNVHNVENRATPAAIGWLCRHDPEYVKSFVQKPTISDSWREIIRALVTPLGNAAKLADSLGKLLSGKSKQPSIEKVLAVWPSLWHRQHMPADVASLALSYLLQYPVVQRETVLPNDTFWRLFAGINRESLMTAICSIDPDDKFAQAVSLLSPLMDVPIEATLLNMVMDRLAKTPNPAAMLEQIHLRLRLAITSANSSSESIYNKIFAEESRVHQGLTYQAPLTFSEDSKEDESLEHDLTARKSFFDLAFRKRTPNLVAGKSLWHKLAEQWQNPREVDLNELAALARKAPELFKLCYLQTLGRYKGKDGAALKVLDFVRSSEESEMLAVVQALAGIGTPRAHQELISCITRPNSSTSLKLEICNRLREADLDNLQSELRSALNDVHLSEGAASEANEIAEAISSLIIPRKDQIATVGQSVESKTETGRDLDVTLAGKIPHYNDLSSEVKRALRTAQFFHDRIEGAPHATTIDLSPVIDMQYKALELLFREAFEESCSNVINDGVLQRKLDVIGYARPIPQAMDEFEKYISSLPVVESIPYFSKFKLRKMLRAICQFRPGKRFTLDGIKAFALFFLCFGRKNCKYGLQNLINLGFPDDQTLAEFGKALHVFQDFRNRAAHEGFHPDAHSDINGIWRSTAEIVQNAYSVKKTFQVGGKSGFFGAPRSEPIVERKNKDPQRQAS